MPVCKKTDFVAMKDSRMRTLFNVSGAIAVENGNFLRKRGGPSNCTVFFYYKLTEFSLSACDFK